MSRLQHIRLNTFTLSLYNTSRIFPSGRFLTKPMLQLKIPRTFFSRNRSSESHTILAISRFLSKRILMEAVVAPPFKRLKNRTSQYTVIVITVCGSLRHRFPGRSAVRRPTAGCAEVFSNLEM